MGAFIAHNIDYVWCFFVFLFFGLSGIILNLNACVYLVIDFAYPLNVFETTISGFVYTVLALETLDAIGGFVIKRLFYFFSIAYFIPVGIYRFSEINTFGFQTLCIPFLYVVYGVILLYRMISMPNPGHSHH